MQESGASREGRTSVWDPLAESLQELRQRSGDPSYAEIARLVGERRKAMGDPAHVVRVARTTVYDAFRTGRTRVNLGLVREIALVLGADDAQVDDWIARCRRPADAAEPATRSRPTVRQALTLMLVGVAVNVLGRFFIEAFDLPIFLDMIGTAIVAIALGPWHGATVGLATNVLGVASSGPASLAFAGVNVAGALIWGYGVRRFGLGRTHLRFLALNLLVAVACTAISVPILLAMFGGTTGHAQDVIATTVYDLTRLEVLAVTASNLMVSVADKLLSGFIALAVLSAAPAAYRSPIRWLAPTPPDATPRGV